MGVRLDFAKEFELALEQEKEKEEKIKQADREQSELIKIKETRVNIFFYYCSLGGENLNLLQLIFAILP